MGIIVSVSGITQRSETLLIASSGKRGPLLPPKVVVVVVLVMVLVVSIVEYTII